ncbi:MAG TPA: hypothetical protein IAB86_01385 [Candidatus Aphodovivens avicola]|nr:hypothetical protein [Candidatus Aphodovivens avicola]
MGFANLFEAMAWRLVKSRMTWAFLAAFAALVVAGVAALKTLDALEPMAAAVSETSSDVALGLSVLDPASGGVSLVAACGALFVRGSFIAMLVAVFCGVFFAADIRSGAVKNVVQGAGARFSYALAACAVTLCVTAAAVVVGTVVSAASLLALGFPLAAPVPLQFAAWLLQVWVSVSAYALIAVAVALVSGSSAVSAIAGLLLGGAALENLLYSALGLLTGRPDEVRQVFDGYLAVTVSQLGYGNVLPWDAMLPVLATIAVVAAAGMMIMRRRRLA